MNTRWRLKPLLTKKQLVIDIFGHFCVLNSVPTLSVFRQDCGVVLFLSGSWS